MPRRRRASRRGVPPARRQCRHRAVLPGGCDRRLPRPANRRICTPMLSWQASMISGKDLLNQFKAASWRGPDEVERFVAEAEAPQTAELLKLLDIVTGKAPDAGVQRARLTVFARLIDKNPDKALFGPFVKAMKSAEP